MLTDMETCYKVMRAEVLRSMTLRSNGFGIEPELTAKIFKRGYRVYEVPITYDGRGYDEGKKITWRDGVVALWIAAEVPVHRVTHPLMRLLRLRAPVPRAPGWRPSAAMLVYAVGSAGLAALIKPIFDKRARQSGSDLGVHRVGASSASICSRASASYVSSYLMADVGQRVVTDLRNAAVSGTSSASRRASSRSGRTGQLMSRITNDVGQVQQAVSETVGDLARESLALVGYAALLFYYDARLALVCLTGAPLIVYPLVRLGPARAPDDAAQPGGARAAVARQRRGVHRPPHRQGVRHRGARGRRSSRARRSSCIRTNMKVTAALSSLPPLMELLGGIGMAAALWYGSAARSRRGRLTHGRVHVVHRGAVPDVRAGQEAEPREREPAAGDRRRPSASSRCSTRTPRCSEQPDAAPLPPFRRAIEFRDVGVRLRRRPRRAILRGVSFTVRAGQMVAIVGRSGAGKTTLVNLLPRFYDVSGGAILIDGVDIRDVTLASLRAQIGIVTQETVLFDDTIANNIAYGSPRATPAAIEAAARAAHAHEFIAALPDGYETMIGERGQRLSGGQRQRLAIARALLKNAPILILDEATSALDTESELLVQDALANLMLNRTSFVIAHRLSTIRRADAIIVLERGRDRRDRPARRAAGAPDGAYATLYQMQLLEGRRRQRTDGLSGADAVSRIDDQDRMTGFASRDARGRARRRSPSRSARSTIGTSTCSCALPQSLGRARERRARAACSSAWRAAASS